MSEPLPSSLTPPDRKILSPTQHHPLPSRIRDPSALGMTIDSRSNPSPAAKNARANVLSRGREVDMMDFLGGSSNGDAEDDGVYGMGFDSRGWVDGDMYEEEDGMDVGMVGGTEAEGQAPQTNQNEEQGQHRQNTREGSGTATSPHNQAEECLFFASDPRPHQAQIDPLNANKHNNYRLRYSSQPLIESDSSGDEEITTKTNTNTKINNEDKTSFEGGRPAAVRVDEPCQASTSTSARPYLYQHQHQPSNGSTSSSTSKAMIPTKYQTAQRAQRQPQASLRTSTTGAGGGYHIPQSGTGAGGAGGMTAYYTYSGSGAASGSGSASVSSSANRAAAPASSTPVKASKTDTQAPTTSNSASKSRSSSKRKPAVLNLLNASSSSSGSNDEHGAGPRQAQAQDENENGNGNGYAHASNGQAHGMNALAAPARAVASDQAFTTTAAPALSMGVTIRQTSGGPSTSLPITRGAHVQARQPPSSSVNQATGTSVPSSCGAPSVAAASQGLPNSNVRQGYTYTYAGVQPAQYIPPTAQSQSQVMGSDPLVDRIDGRSSEAAAAAVMSGSRGHVRVQAERGGSMPGQAGLSAVAGSGYIGGGTGPVQASGQEQDQDQQRQSHTESVLSNPANTHNARTISPHAPVRIPSVGSSDPRTPSRNKLTGEDARICLDGWNKTSVEILAEMGMLKDYQNMLREMSRSATQTFYTELGHWMQNLSPETKLKDILYKTIPYIDPTTGETKTRIEHTTPMSIILEQFRSWDRKAVEFQMRIDKGMEDFDTVLRRKLERGLEGLVDVGEMGQGSARKPAFVKTTNHQHQAQQGAPSTQAHQHPQSQGHFQITYIPPQPVHVPQQKIQYQVIKRQNNIETIIDSNGFVFEMYRRQHPNPALYAESQYASQTAGQAGSNMARNGLQQGYPPSANLPGTTPLWPPGVRGYANPAQVNDQTLYMPPKKTEDHESTYQEESGSEVESPEYQFSQGQHGNLPAFLPPASQGNPQPQTQNAYPHGTYQSQQLQQQHRQQHRHTQIPVQSQAQHPATTSTSASNHPIAQSTRSRATANSRPQPQAAPKLPVGMLEAALKSAQSANAGLPMTDMDANQVAGSGKGTGRKRKMQDQNGAAPQNGVPATKKKKTTKHK